MFNEFCQDLCKLTFKEFESDRMIHDMSHTVCRKVDNIQLPAVSSIKSHRNLNQSSAKTN